MVQNYKEIGGHTIILDGVKVEGKNTCDNIIREIDGFRSSFHGHRSDLFQVSGVNPI